MTSLREVLTVGDMQDDVCPLNDALLDLVSDGDLHIIRTKYIKAIKNLVPIDWYVGRSGIPHVSKVCAGKNAKPFADHKMSIAEVMDRWNRVSTWAPDEFRRRPCVHCVPFEVVQ